MLKALDTGTELDVVFFISEQEASGVIRVVGNFGHDAHLARSLTTASQPMGQLGGRAADMLFEGIAGRAVPSVTLPTTLITRQSYGCRVDQGG